MKYLIIGDGNSPHLLKWAKGLKDNVDLYIFSFNKISEDLRNLLGEKKVFSAGYSLNPNGGNQSILKSISVLNSFVKYINPTVVNPHYITSNGFMAVLLKKLVRYDYKIVSSCWGSDILVNPHKNFLYKKITKYILDNSDLITSDSYYMSDEISKFCNKPILTFPFGVETLPEKRGKDRLLFFSNRMFKENYNIDKIIDFFSKVYQLDNNARLVIANDGPLRDVILRKIESLSLNSAVKYLGFLDKDRQNEIYAKSSFYISIPDSDTTSVSLLEAMSFGCVPIVSNIPSVREWVWDGYNGIYFDDDPKKILDLQSEIDIMGDRNREIIYTRAIWHKNISKFLKVIYGL